MSPSQPRVLLMAHRFASHQQSGIPRYVVELCNAIGRRDDAGGYALVTPPEKGDASNCGLPVERLRGGRRPVQLGWHLVRRPRLDHLVAPADLVHVLYPFAPVPTRAPLVVTVHDLLPLTRPEWFASSDITKFRRATRQLATGAAHVVADSRVVAAKVEEVLGVDPDRITVVPLGVAPTFRSPPPADQQLATCGRFGLTPGRFFVAVGYVSRRKNLLTLLQALAAAGPRLRVPIVLAGPPGHGADGVMADADRLGLIDRVVVSGWLSEEDLGALMASATALLHPATDEGFGLPPLEAMAAGTPVIASLGGAVPEVVGDAALLLDPGDVDGWADAMVRLVGDAALARRLSTAGSARAAAFTWERTADETLAVHRRVLSRAP